MSTEGKRVWLVTVGMGGPGMGRRLETVGKFICDPELGERDDDGRLISYNLPLKCKINSTRGYGYRVRCAERMYQNGKLEQMANGKGAST